MKIVIVHNAYPQYGGEDTVVANEMAMLMNHGYEVVPWIIPTEESGVINLIRCGLSAVWNPIAARRLKALLEREKPDIVHCHNTFPLLSPSIFAACHDAGVPVVQTIHNYRHICPAGSFYRDGRICEECIGKRFPSPAVRYGCYRNSRIASLVPAMSVYAQRVRHTFERDLDALIVLNKFAKNKLIAGGIPAGKIVIKPNFCLEPPVQKPVERPVGKPFTVCFAGRFSEDKGILVLLEAWQSFLDSLDAEEKRAVNLQFVGSGDLQKTILQATEGYDSIHYLGSLSHSETVSVIAQADCLVFPSHLYEGMPMTLLEAFSVGTPVIASRIGGVPGMVDDGINGFLFTPGCRSELETHLHAFHAAPQMREEMGRKARDIFCSRYSEPVNFGLLESIYRTIIADFGGQ